MVYRTCNPANDGLFCAGCGEFSCFQCVVSILKEIKRKHKLAYQNDPLCQEFVSCMKARFKRPRHLRFCHRCWFRDEMKEMDRQHELMLDTCNKSLYGDGFIYLPDFGIVIDSPMVTKRFVDVHGFGEETMNELNAVSHMVINWESTRNIFTSKQKFAKVPVAGGPHSHISRFSPREISFPNYLKL